MNGKAKGSRNERRSMKLLEAAGYRCTKAAASLGAWDIIGIGSNDIILVQVKSNCWPRSVEMETMKDFPVPPNAKRIIHKWTDRKRLPDTKEII